MNKQQINKHIINPIWRRLYYTNSIQLLYLFERLQKRNICP